MVIFSIILINITTSSKCEILEMREIVNFRTNNVDLRFFLKPAPLPPGSEGKEMIRLMIMMVIMDIMMVVMVVIMVIIMIINNDHRGDHSCFCPSTGVIMMTTLVNMMMSTVMMMMMIFKAMMIDV